MLHAVTFRPLAIAACGGLLAWHAVAAAASGAAQAAPVQTAPVAADRGAPLRLTSELASVPGVAAQQRARAAALWAALQATPEEAIQQQLRSQALQRELQAVRDGFLASVPDTTPAGEVLRASSRLGVHVDLGEPGQEPRP